MQELEQSVQCGTRHTLACAVHACWRPPLLGPRQRCQQRRNAHASGAGDASACNLLREPPPPPSRRPAGLEYNAMQCNAMHMKCTRPTCRYSCFSPASPVSSGISGCVRALMGRLSQQSCGRAASEETSWRRSAQPHRHGRRRAVTAQASNQSVSAAASWRCGERGVSGARAWPASRHVSAHRRSCSLLQRQEPRAQPPRTRSFTAETRRDATQPRHRHRRRCTQRASPRRAPAPPPPC